MHAPRISHAGFYGMMKRFRKQSKPLEEQRLLFGGRRLEDGLSPARIIKLLSLRKHTSVRTRRIRSVNSEHSEPVLEAPGVRIQNTGSI